MDDVIVAIILKALAESNIKELELFSSKKSLFEFSKHLFEFTRMPKKEDRCFLMKAIYSSNEAAFSFVLNRFEEGVVRGDYSREQISADELQNSTGLLTSKRETFLHSAARLTMKRGFVFEALLGAGADLWKRSSVTGTCSVLEVAASATRYERVVYCLNQKVLLNVLNEESKRFTNAFLSFEGVFKKMQGKIEKSSRKALARVIV